MKMKYWRLNVKGERSADEIQSTIGQSGGNVLRIHFEGAKLKYISLRSQRLQR